MMQQQLGNILRKKGIDKTVVTVVSQMLVDKNDPAFKMPSKPVGPFYGEGHAREAMEEKGEYWIEDSGRGWRRVVASPRPQGLVELRAVKKLLDAGCVVIANGGGGIPVVDDGEGFKGIEAVIDKDFGGKRLAVELEADVFMILTDVPKVYVNYGTPGQKAIDRIGISELKKLQEEGHFKAGSMGPKIEACRLYVEVSGNTAIITSLDTAIDALKGEAGTIIEG
jgi:carbamate kinase